MFKKIGAKVVKKAALYKAVKKASASLAKNISQTKTAQGVKTIKETPQRIVGKVKDKTISSIKKTRLGQHIDKSTNVIKKKVAAGKALFQKNPTLAALSKKVFDEDELKKSMEELKTYTPEAQGLRYWKIVSETVIAIQYSKDTQTMIIHFSPLTTTRENYPNGFPSIVVFGVDYNEARRFQRVKNHMRYYNKNYSFAYSPRKYDTATLQQAINTLQELDVDGRKDPDAMLEWKATFASYKQGEWKAKSIDKAKTRTKKEIKKHRELFEKYL